MSKLTKFLEIYHGSKLRGSYQLISFLSHRLKSLQCIPFQTDYGVVYADLRIPIYHGLLGFTKNLSGEDMVMRRFVTKGDVVFDIGVFWGLYTVLLSQLVGEKGKVYAFEPNPKLLPSLELTAESLSNVKLYPIALSDKQGEVNFFVPEEDASMASLSDWTNGIAGDVYKITCKMQRLDDLVEEEKIPAPNFIKCDVEGAELSVFNGGIKTLNRVDAPIVMFELNPKAAQAFGINITSYFDFLKSLEHSKYTYFEVSNNGIVSINGVNDLKFNEDGYTNVLAVPAFKRDLCRNI